MEAKEVTKWQDEKALERFKLISQLIDPDLDPAKRAQLRQEIARNNGISERSLFRYEKAYRQGSFTGLKPVSRRSPRRTGGGGSWSATRASPGRATKAQSL